MDVVVVAVIDVELEKVEIVASGPTAAWISVELISARDEVLSADVVTKELDENVVDGIEVDDGVIDDTSVNCVKSGAVEIDIL